MFWKKKKTCYHEWHYLQDSKIHEYLDDTSYCTNVIDACWIFCPKCQEEMEVSKRQWERFKKKEKILEEYQRRTEEE